MVDDSLVKDATNPKREEAIRVNDRNSVLQITYIESIDTDALATAVNWPGNSNPANLQLFFRIVVDQRARTHWMTLNGANLLDNEPNTWGVVITDQIGNPDSEKQDYGETIAHEAGHVLSLRHRDSSTASRTTGIRAGHGRQAFGGGPRRVGTSSIWLLLLGVLSSDERPRS